MTVESEVKSLRLQWFTEYISAMRQEHDPRAMAAVSAITNIWEVHRPAICVSFHVGRFLDFFYVARHLPMDIIAFVDGPIQHYSSKARWLVPKNVELCSTLSAADYKRLKRGTAMMFVMADIVTPNQGFHFVDAFGGMATYTTAWAELAVKLRSDAMVVLTPPRNHQQFFAEYLPVGNDPCEPVEQAFGMLESYLEKPGDWENEPLHRQRSHNVTLQAALSRDELYHSISGLLSFDSAMLSYLKETYETC